jgi:hypothetical protein
MIYEGNDRETTTLTWGELHTQVVRSSAPTVVWKLDVFSLPQPAVLADLTRCGVTGWCYHRSASSRTC